jgi:hypothetical protein
MARHKPPEVRHALLEPAHANRREAAFAPGDIVIRPQLQITVPSGGRIVQRARLGEQFLDIAALWRRTCRLRQQSHGRESGGINVTRRPCRT